MSSGVLVPVKVKTRSVGERLEESFPADYAAPKASTIMRSEALIELGFEFDWVSAARSWQEDSNAFHKLPDELHGISLVLGDDQSPLQLPKHDYSRCNSDEYTREYLKSCPENLQALLLKFPELQYFLTQFAGLPLCDASVHALQNLDDGVLFGSQGKSTFNVVRQIKVKEEALELVITGSSRRRHWPYVSLQEIEKSRFFLESDEAILRIPIDLGSNTLRGQAKLSSCLLLSMPEGSSMKAFQSDIEVIQKAKDYGMLSHYVGDQSGLVKSSARTFFNIPPVSPKKTTLLATPLFSGSVFAGAALVAALVFAVAPPLGLGLVASALIMAGIGALIGTGISAIRARNHSTAVKDYEKTRAGMAIAFGEPVLNISLDRNSIDSGALPHRLSDMASPELKSDSTQDKAFLAGLAAEPIIV